MAATLLTIRTDSRRDIGSPPTAIVTDAEVNSRINDSYFEILTRYRHPDIEQTATFATVAGTRNYAVPSDYWYTKILRDETNDRVLLYRPMEWIEAQDVDTRSQPQYWTLWGTNQVLVPTPDGAYTVTRRYVRRPPALSADADATLVGREWDEIIRWGAVWRLFMMLGEFDRMIHARNVWRTLVNTMPETEVLESEKGFQVVPVLLTHPVPSESVAPTE